MRTALIVGGSGFLGSYLAAACHESGQKLLGVSFGPPADRSLWAGFAEGDLERVDLVRLVDGCRLDTCFILSGRSSVADSMLDPAGDFGMLLPGLARLLTYVAHKQRDCHVVLFSSAAVYGNPVQTPTSESAAISPLSPYGVHKWLAEEMLRRYSEIFALRASILRIFSAYGVGLRRQLFWDLLRKYEEAVANGSYEIALSGTGHESRDFIHGMDVARAALLISQRGLADGHETYNVASGVSVTIKDAATILTDCLRERVNLRFSGVERAGDPLYWQADIGKLLSLGYRNSIDIEKGLEGYAEWAHQKAEIKSCLSARRGV